MTKTRNNPLNRSKSPRSSSSSTRRSIKSSGSRKANVPMAKANKIPPGVYRSKIASIKDVTTQAGDDAVEVVYDLTAADGSRLKMREIIPIDSYYYEKFGDALISAGLEEGADLQDAIGIEEDVVLDYPSPGGIGHFKSRRPVFADTTPVVISTPDLDPIVADSDLNTEADEEFDDFLEDDEDED